jgi:hypothetical protein
MSSFAFSCEETPLALPSSTLNITTCTSCTLRLTALLPGDGSMPTATNETFRSALRIQENGQTGLEVNGQKYNLRETYLLMPGAHKLPDRPRACAAELELQFSEITDATRHIFLILPLDKGFGGTNKYFDALGTNKTEKERPTLESLFKPTMNFIQYDGPGKPSGSQSNGRCASTVRYIVSMQPALIGDEAFARFSKKLNAIRGSPPAPTQTITAERYRLLCSIINGIRLGAPPAVGATTNGIDMSAMKCYRLDPDRDVHDGKVYVGGPRESDLPTELESGEALSDVSYLGSTQRWIGIALGIVVGVLLLLLLVGFVGPLIYSGFSKKGDTVSQIGSFFQRASSVLPRLGGDCPKPAVAAAGAAAAATAPILGK